MHEVKVNESLGKLKKVISTQTLNIRSKQQLETSEMFLETKGAENHGQNLLIKTKQKPKHHKLIISIDLFLK
jgi:hypothetical protein